MMLVSAFAACGGSEEPTTTLAVSTTTSTQEAVTVAAVPAGFIKFATLGADNAVNVEGLSFIQTATSETIVVEETNVITANFTDGVVTSATTAGGVSFQVFELKELDGTKSLYALAGDEITTTSSVTIDLGNLNAPSKANTTTKKVTTTKKSTTLPKVSKPKTTVPRSLSPEDEVYQSQKEAIEKNPNLSASEKRAAINLLSYKVDENGIFYVEHEPWQKTFGFNSIYDAASPLIQLIYGTIRVKFRYGYVYKTYTDGDKKGQVMYDESNQPVYETDSLGKPIAKDWMIQLWKGRYGLVMLGGEIGVYTKPSTQNTSHYYSALAEEELVMAMDCYQQNFLTGEKKHLFTRGPESAWWLTGFVPGSFYEYNKKSEVIMVANIQFPNTDMLSAFETPFAAAGFSKGSPGPNNPETYTTSGTSLKLSWQYIDQDA
jgi:hypothetical protein